MEPISGLYYWLHNINLDPNKDKHHKQNQIALAMIPHKLQLGLNLDLKRDAGIAILNT